MKTNSSKIISGATAVMLVVVFGILIGGASVYADDIQTAAVQRPMDPNASALFELINVARQYPLGMAEFIGLDRNQIMRDLPEMADIFKTGLPLLTIDSRLNQTAAEHTTEMLQNHYYSYVSMDGRSVDQRMTDAGYIPSASGESLGMIAFNNFLNPQKAVLQIFKNIYRNELDPAFDGQRNILNPDVREVGIGFSGGVFQFERYSVNAYLVTCDFGSEVALQDLQLLQLINQARAYPLAVADFYRKDLNGFFEAFPEYLERMTNGLPVLSLNLSLYNAAAAHASDMVENEYVSHVSLDNQTPAMRLQAAGYFPSWTAESIYRMPVYNACEDDFEITEFKDDFEITELFKVIFSAAFRTEGWSDRNIFAPEAIDAGLHVAPRYSAKKSICQKVYQLAVIEYAAKDGPASPGPGITGTVYEDLNGNGLYDAGEGVAGATVAISKTGMELAYENDIINNLSNSNQVKTNAAGGFSLKTEESGSYNIRVDLDNEEATHTFTVQVENNCKWMGLDIGTAN